MYVDFLYASLCGSGWSKKIRHRKLEIEKKKIERIFLRKFGKIIYMGVVVFCVGGVCMAKMCI